MLKLFPTKMRILLQCLALALVSSAALAQESLSAPGVVDVGEIQVNEVGKFNFELVNKSSEELGIEEVKTSCACTSVSIARGDRIVAGAKQVVAGAVNFGAQVGAYQTKITIRYLSKTGRAGMMMVPIRGMVVAAVLPDRSVLDFGQLDQKAGLQTLTCDLKRGNAKQNWDSVEAVCGSDRLQATIKRESDALFHLEVRFDPTGLAISTFRSSLKLICRLDRQAIALPHELAVTAQIKGPIRATPASFYLGVMEPGAVVARAVTLSSSELDLRDLAIEKLPDGMKAELVGAADHQVKINCEAGPATLEGTINEVLTVMHRSSGVKLNIPILGAVKAKRPR